MIEKGQHFPTFSLPNQDGVWITNQDHAGKWAVFFLYPKDDTPGCTLESQAFSARKKDFDALNVCVYGLSQDSVSSHQAFCKKYSLATQMLSDENQELLKALDLGQSQWKGQSFWDRTTVVVNPQGNIQTIYKNVDPRGHELQVLQDIQRWMGERS
ncbi:MAG: peroxiredoxin [Bdellovibrionota bacterium]